MKTSKAAAVLCFGCQHKKPESVTEHTHPQAAQIHEIIDEALVVMISFHYYRDLLMITKLLTINHNFISSVRGSTEQLQRKELL